MIRMTLIQNCLVLLLAGSTVFAFGAKKQALVQFEMANYFLQGNDLDNALKYYSTSRGKLGIEKLEVVLCRNMANAYLLKGDRTKTQKLLSECIAKFSYEIIQDSAPMREIYKVYAQLLADDINPKILDQKRQLLKQRYTDMHQNQKIGKKKPKLGFK